MNGDHQRIIDEAIRDWVTDYAVREDVRRTLEQFFSLVTRYDYERRELIFIYQRMSPNVLRELMRRATGKIGYWKERP